MISIHRDGIEQIRHTGFDSHLSVPYDPSLTTYRLVRDVEKELESRVGPAPLYEVFLILSFGHFFLRPFKSIEQSRPHGGH